MGGAHAAFSDHAGSGMIGLARFGRTLTRYRNDSTDIAGTAHGRPICISSESVGVHPPKVRLAWLLFRS